MRILIANEGMGEAGGVESYLTAVLRGLGERGHDVAFLHYNRRADSGDWPESLVNRTFGVLDEGLESVVADLEMWHPDICYVHNMQALEVDRALLARWPVVKMMHGYFGTCVSGQKSFGWPGRTPCSRRFGEACLALYLPRRCGQLRVGKMFEQYRWARAQRELFGSYAGLVVASEHMGQEYRRHGVDGGRIHVVPLFAPACGDPTEPNDGPPPGTPRVLFLGRMTELKGGDLLVRAVARVMAATGRQVELVMAGDGPQRPAWERLARALKVRASFPGWVDPAARERLFRDASVLAVPSVWPEPFGLVGLEAGSFGVPAVAFDVGGIRQWLQPGRNGFLASAAPPSPEALAKALDQALSRASDPAFRAGARQIAQAMTLAVHLDRLETVLADAVAKR